MLDMKGRRKGGGKTPFCFLRRTHYRGIRVDGGTQFAHRVAAADPEAQPHGRLLCTRVKKKKSLLPFIQHPRVSGGGFVFNYRDNIPFEEKKGGPISVPVVCDCSLGVPREMTAVDRKRGQSKAWPVVTLLCGLLLFGENSWTVF